MVASADNNNQLFVKSMLKVCTVCMSIMIKNHNKYTIPWMCQSGQKFDSTKKELGGLLVSIYGIPHAATIHRQFVHNADTHRIAEIINEYNYTTIIPITQNLLVSVQ